MLRSYRFVFLGAVAVGLLFGGCRTYGDYGTPAKTYDALQTTVQSFESELKRARADLRRLEEAATQADTLQSLAKDFHELVSKHESLLETQHQRIDRLSSETSYRTLHSAYGATVTEQRIMKEKYQRVIRTVRAAVQGPVAQASSPKTDRRYTVRPIGFPTPPSKKELSMEQALRGL